MICYRDITYCAANCANQDCFRNKGMLDLKAVSASGLPVAYADLQHDCKNYVPDFGMGLDKVSVLLKKQAC